MACHRIQGPCGPPESGPPRTRGRGLAWRPGLALMSLAATDRAVLSPRSHGNIVPGPSTLSDALAEWRESVLCPLPPGGRVASRCVCVWVTGLSQWKSCLCARDGLALQEAMPTEVLQRRTDGKCRQEHLSWGHIRDTEGDQTKPGLRWSAALLLRAPLCQPQL